MLNLKRPTIAMLINHFNDYIFPYCIGALNKAAELGADIRVFCQPSVNTEHDVSFRDMENYAIHRGSFSQILDMLVAYNVEGLIVTNDLLNFMDSDLLEEFLAKNPNMYAATITNALRGASLIQADNYVSSKMAIEHMIDKHQCQSIYYIRGPNDNEEANDRYRAYLDVLSERGIPFSEELVYQGDWFFKAGTDAVKFWLDHHDSLPDAIAAANDNMVYGAIEYLQTLGLSVPKDVKAIGFDNSIYAENSGISSVAQSFEEMAAIAVNEVYWRIQNKEPETNKILVPCPVVIRRGCGCKLSNLVSVEGDRVNVIEAFRFENFSNPESHLKSATEEQRNLLCADVRLFLSAFSNVACSETIKSNALESMADMLNQMVQKHLIMNINVSYWADLLLEIQVKCDQLNIQSEYFSTFFSDCRAITNGFINSYISNIHLIRDVLAYSNINASKRLLSVNDINKVCQISLEFLRDVGADFGIILLLPEDRNLEKSKVMKLAGRLQDGDIELFKEDKQLVSLDELQKVSQHGEKGLSHFHVQGVVPLGLAGEVVGYFVTDIRADRDRWNSMRSLQVYFTQAIKNLSLLNEQSRVSSLSAADELKADFISRMTHELRTPMNGVVGMTELLQETELSDEQRYFVQIIQNSSNIMLNLIGEVLDFSSVKNNQIQLDFKDFNLQKFVEVSIGLIAKQCDEKSAYIGYRFEPDVPLWINQDQTKIQQAVTNILNNAVKFTENGKVFIEVFFNKEKRAVSIAISNTGEEIDEPTKQSLFLPFQQGGSEIHRKHGGTGLGLPLSKKICEALGGDLVLDPSFSGGARFILSFAYHVPEKAHSLLPWQEKVPPKNVPYRKIFLVSNYLDDSVLVMGVASQWGIDITEIPMSDFVKKLENCQSESPNECCFIFDILDESLQESKAILDLYRFGEGCKLICLLGMKSKFDRNLPLKSIVWLRRPVTARQLYYALFQVSEPQAVQAAANDDNGAVASLEHCKPMRILLAEDNIVNQQVATAILKKFGYELDVVDNGAKAVSRNKESEYDVILMDILMPEMDGATATKLIQQQSEESKCPYIIAVTANTQKGDREKLLAGGMDDYVSKPIDANQLAMALSRAFRKVSKRDF